MTQRDLQTEKSVRMTRNREWRKGNSESSSEYATRMLGELRKVARRGVTSSLPYDPSTSLGGDWTAAELREAEQERLALQDEDASAF